MKPRKLTPTKLKALDVYARANNVEFTYMELSNALFKETGTRINWTHLMKYIKAEWRVVHKKPNHF
jgi:hypothetical protein